MDQTTKAEWDALTAAEQWELYQLTERRESRLDELLDLLPCPVHGRCIPYAKDRILAMLGQ